MSDQPFDSNILQEALDILNVSFYILDMNGKIEYANKSCCMLAGVSKEQIIGMQISEIMMISGIDGPDLVSHIAKARKEIRFTGLVDCGTHKKRGLGIAAPIFSGDTIVHVSVLIWDADDSVHILGELLDVNNVLTMDEIMLDELLLLRSKQTSAENIVAESDELKQILKEVDSLADVDVNILITGESGVGKEIIADRIYSNSSRKGSPFIKVNCAAIPENLLEAEFFGYEKGAFTGASTTGKSGFFELANMGYIFLDEIGELPYNLQSKLLRVIQQKEMFRVGGTKSIKLDVRIIAATNCDLRARVDQGLFRADLFYRLNVVTFIIPPLRERTKDILALADFFLTKYAKKYNKSVYFSRRFKQKLCDYNWPGNVRELENVIERMVIISSEGVLSASKLAEITGREPIYGETPGLQESIENFEREAILSALKEGGTARAAAKLLKISAPTICRKMKQYGIAAKYEA